MDLSQQIVQLTSCADINAYEKINFIDYLLKNQCENNKTININTIH